MSREFAYKTVDDEGLETLDVLSSANKLNQWFYDTISPYCKGDILEIGSGIGNISNFFVLNGRSLHMSDIRENYIEILKSKFSERPVVNLDLVDPDFDLKYNNLFEKYDSIYSLNVIEHIKDDTQAIKNCFKLLKKGGTLVTLVPAYEFLYNNFDVELCHYKRYNSETVYNLLSGAGGIVEKIFYFNLLGTFGWFLNGRVLKKKTLPKGQVNLYNIIVPIARILDKLLFNRIGLSVICIARKER